MRWNFPALLCLSLLYSTALFAQQASILSGPMPGYSTLNEVGIWLQLNEAGTVELEYWDPETPDKTTKSNAFKAVGQQAYTVHIAIPNLAPGKEYQYRIWIDGAAQASEHPLTFHTQTHWQYRTDPPAFKVALGSCTYINEEGYDRPGTPYGKGYHIFEHIADQQPDMMLWLGDNIYLRERDWSSWSGYLHRYTHTRSLPEMQRLLRTTHHYAIWDDHDFGPNNANGSWIHKDWALESFRLFWMNPSFGLPDVKGITTAFQFNDMDFFLLDNRYNRTPDNLVHGGEHILGEQQIEWLIHALKSSRAPFKLVAVGGQVINTARVYENHAVYAEERKDLLRRIAEEKIEGVVFLTGDRHHTELSKFTADNGIVIYDLTVSPFTSKAYDVDNETNGLRVEGTVVEVQNFGMLEFTGPHKERSMSISIFDSSGKVLWERKIEP